MFDLKSYVQLIYNKT